SNSGPEAALSSGAAASTASVHAAVIGTRRRTATTRQAPTPHNRSKTSARDSDQYRCPNAAVAAASATAAAGSSQLLSPAREALDMADGQRQRDDRRADAATVLAADPPAVHG